MQVKEWVRTFVSEHPEASREEVRAEGVKRGYRSQSIGRAFSRVQVSTERRTLRRTDRIAAAIGSLNSAIDVLGVPACKLLLEGR